MDEYKVLRGTLQKGQIIRVDLSEGYYQVLDFIKTIKTKSGDDNYFYVRKVFNSKLEFKLSKAQVITDSLIIFPRKSKIEQINGIINNNCEIKNELLNLKICPKYEWSSVLIVKAKESKIKDIMMKMNSNSLFSQKDGIKMINHFINKGYFLEVVYLYDTQALLEMSEKNLYFDECFYRIEVGRSVDDYDKNFDELYRKFRFVKLKVGIEK
ncbi:MAG: hypothetical protein J1F32_03940 [Erysipelotrichales bacterium]|nr:hypothetical protein [Erysipelotrichales bacterium]